MVKHKVTTEDLEDLLVELQVEEIYKKRNLKEINRKDKEYKAYKEYVKKPRHPISYELEIESRTTLQQEWDNMFWYWDIGFMFMIGYMGFWLSIGGIFLLLMFLWEPSA